MMVVFSDVIVIQVFCGDSDVVCVVDDSIITVCVTQMMLLSLYHVLMTARKEGGHSD